MREILFHIGPFPIYSYGTMLAISFFLGITVAEKLGKKNNIEPDLMFSLCFSIVWTSLLGAKLLFIIANYQDYIDDPLSIFQISGGGFVFYGGLLSAFMFSYWFTRKHKMNSWATFDALAPSVALGLGITRIGCFLSGCCFGKPTTLPWAIQFPEGSPAYEQLGSNHHIHPTQLYSSFDGFLLFAILLIIWKHKKFNGQVTLTFLGIYSLARLWEEYLRTDDARGYWGPFNLSTSQWISLAMFIYSGLMFFRLRKTQKL